MAPILSLLRALQETERVERETAYYYGARTEADLFQLEELETLPCGFVPALSEDSNGWKGESGLITDVVDRLEGDVAEVDAYVCGPPPMVEATIALLERKGVPEAHIYLRQVHDHRGRVRRPHGDRGQGTQRPQADVHGRRGWGARSSPPGRAAATTTSSRASAARPSMRTSRSTSSPTPSAT